MASTYPGAQDVFPGYPYVDFTQYIDASYANSWVSALLAIEATIGLGSGTSILNPLYSPQYGQFFATITARIANVEAFVVGSVSIDTASGDYKPVGSSTSAGSPLTGKSADAAHVHAGVASFNGRTGSVTTQATDFGAAFTAAGQIIVGTGNGTATSLAPGAVGSVLQVGAGNALQWASAGASSWLSGDLKFTSATTVPSGWLAANGAAVSRSSFAALLTASTIQFTGTASGTTISGLSTSVTGALVQGMSIEGPGLGSSVTIQSVASTSITVSSAPTAGSQTFTVYPYGNGDGSSTFNVINMLDRVPVGSGNSFKQGQSGGEQTHILSTAELAVHTHTNSLTNPTHQHVITTSIQDPTHVHSITDPGHDHPVYLAGYGVNYQLLYTTPTVQTTTINTIQGQGSGLLNFSWGAPNAVFIQVANTGIGGTNGAATGIGATSSETAVAQGTTITNANAGSGSAHNNMQPYVAGQWLVKT
jgi:microcystin-dependent protein